MSWRANPLLKNRLHPDFPDDLQVIVHDGGPRLCSTTPELMWVSVTGESEGVFSGRVLNEPQNLTTVKAGDTVLFLVTEACEHPFRVSPKYLAERSNWKVTPCDKCGFGDMFDAPSDVQNKLFPDLPEGASMDAFTSFCPICGGIQLITSRDVDDERHGQRNRRWWQFWKVR